MRVWEVASRLMDTALDLCVSPICVACENPIESGSLCPGCQAFELIDENICLSCGASTPSAILSCGCCMKGCPELKSTRSLFWLNDSSRNLLHKVKYQGQMELLSLFEPWFRKISLPFSAELTIIPVPMHPWKWALRGFNQAEILARWMARALGAPLESDGLIKPKATQSQSLLPRSGRLKNLVQAFEWGSVKNCPQKILLVDDVVTTGATLIRCARALKNAGAEEIHGWTLFRARPRSTFGSGRSFH